MDTAKIEKVTGLKGVDGNFDVGTWRRSLEYALLLVHCGFKDDHALNAAEWIVYDALYAYCQKSCGTAKTN